jgi:hypothetical protein
MLRREPNETNDPDSESNDNKPDQADLAPTKRFPDPAGTATNQSNNGNQAEHPENFSATPFGRQLGAPLARIHTRVNQGSKQQRYPSRGYRNAEKRPTPKLIAQADPSNGITTMKSFRVRRTSGASGIYFLVRKTEGPSHGRAPAAALICAHAPADKRSAHLLLFLPGQSAVDAVDEPRAADNRAGGVVDVSPAAGRLVARPAHFDGALSLRVRASSAVDGLRCHGAARSKDNNHRT